MFEWLELAFAARDVHMVFLTVDSRWDQDRADPRFETIIRKCGFKGDGHQLKRNWLEQRIEIRFCAV